MSANHKTGTGKAKTKKRKKNITPARRAAFQILLTIERGDLHSDELLHTQIGDAVSSADRNLATALVLGALRWQIRLDHRLQLLLERPNAKLDAEVLIALRLGAFQILHMDRIPARAAIDESVELTRQAGHRFASGMVNAVLRKLASAQGVEYAEADLTELALAQAHPLWMLERWARFFGIETARAICQHGQRQPSLTIRISEPGLISDSSDTGIVFEPGKILTSARRILSGDIHSSEAIRNGRIRIQDEGSQLVAELAAASVGKNDCRILDPCAAPGGKTLILAERCPQASIVACDASLPRFEALRERLMPFKDRIECRRVDAAVLTEEATFDLVLADVPCSGTGTLGRNPEIRHRLRVEDLARQAERQRAILKAALHAVRPGGRVVYSTCSLEPEENEDVIAAVLLQAPRVQQAEMKALIDGMKDRKIIHAPGAELLKTAVTSSGSLRLLPGMFATDGFFVSVLERSVEDAE